MKTLIRVAVMTLSLGAMPALADSEVSPPEAQAVKAQQPGYVYSNGTGAPVQVYNTQANRGTWLFPPNPSAK